MDIESTFINDLYVLKPKIFGDKRGYFFECYNKRELSELGINYNFVQDNESKSKKGVLRGLHYQIQHQQAKLVRVIKGEVFDVAVDLRNDSKTYGKWFGVILSEENKKQFLIPRGFAHGFLVLSDEAIFSYKCDNFYYPNDEGGIMWDDPDINIMWPFKNNIILSDKDTKHNYLKDSKVKL